MSADEPELLTVAEAAGKLGITGPRLRRLLARPEYAGYVQTVKRETVTGMRTASVVPVTVIVLLEKSLQSEIEPNSNSNSTQRDRVTVIDLLREQLAEKDRQIERLHQLMMADKQEMQKDREELRRLRPLAAITEAPTPTEAAPNDDPNNPPAVVEKWSIFRWMRRDPKKK